MRNRSTCSKIPWCREPQQKGKCKAQICTGLYMGKMQELHQVHRQNLNKAVLAVCNRLELHQAQHLWVLDVIHRSVKSSIWPKNSNNLSRIIWTKRKPMTSSLLSHGCPLLCSVVYLSHTLLFFLLFLKLNRPWILFLATKHYHGSIMKTQSSKA